MGPGLIGSELTRALRLFSAGGVGLMTLFGLPGCAGPFGSAVDMAQAVWRSSADQPADTARIDPRYAYLRVQGPQGPAALLVLGFQDTGPQGEVQTWYSAGREALQTVHGRIRLTHGLSRNRLNTLWPEGLPASPAQSSAAGPASANTSQYVQIIDESAPGAQGLRLVVTLQEVALAEVPSEVRARIGGERGKDAPERLWRWQREDARIDQPGHPRHGTHYSTGWIAFAGSRLAFSQQCLSPDFCLSLQPWPAVAIVSDPPADATPPARPAPASPAPARPAASPPAVLDLPVQAGERVSEWLLRAIGPVGDTGVVHWRVATEVPEQARLKDSLLARLASLHPPGATDPLQAIQQWLRQQPLTGRVPLESPWARALQVRPDTDPVLGAQDRMQWFARPTQVAVLDSAARPCLQPHSAHLHAADYVAACLAARRTEPLTPPRQGASWAWIVQPDGRVHAAGIAAWNQSAQPQPAPGAWIWAPDDAAAIPKAVSQSLAQVLATLPPAGHIPPFAPSAVQPSDRPTPPSRAASADQHADSSQHPTVRPLSARPTDAALTASDWGEIGLLQTPTARMVAAGAARFNVSRITPYTHGNVMFQPLDWLEFGFRYTDISNRLYGPSIAGSQSYKDKSIDFKIRLREESRDWPAIALGIRDFGGTGLFAGEYLVANKRWSDWDFSLGLGWGYLGARGNLDNPLSLFGDRWRTRPASLVGEGGIPATQSFFRGPTSLFGGVQYRANDQWVFKAEIDGNHYRREPQGNTQRQSSPLNLSVVYRQTPWLDWALGLERGNTLMLGLTLHTGPMGMAALSTPKVLDPALPAIGPLAAAAPRAASSDASAAATPVLEESSLRQLRQALRQQTGWTLKSLTLRGPQAQALIDTDRGVHARKRLDAVVRLMHAALPPEVRHFDLRLQQRGLRLTQVSIDRAEWVREHTQAMAPSQKREAVVLKPDDAPSSPFLSLPEPALGVALSPSYQQVLGGPDGFLLYKLGVQVEGQWRWRPGTWLAGTVDLRVLDNFDRFKYTAPSELPRVRTYAREYATASRLTLPHLQATHVAALGGGHFVSLYGGLLEPMFAGAGAEWFWRPWGRPIALGIDLNRVQQRDFDQDFGLRDYRVSTGHLSVYWDTGWHDIHAKLMVGQYLAGDVGATLDLRRQFRNGVSIGAWATKTNVSAAQFGEGSFDKGIYLLVPFDALLARSTPGVANIVWNPLTRDGGARLNRRYTLEELTRQAGPGAWALSPPGEGR